MEGTANSAAVQLRNYGIGFILGLAAVGYLQAANTLMGPFQVMLYGMGLVALPEAARILRRSPRHMPLFCGLLSVGLALLALAWGVALLVALPRGLGNWLLGPIWRPAYPLVLPTTLYFRRAGAPASARARGCMLWGPRGGACVRRLSTRPPCSYFPWRGQPRQVPAGQSTVPRLGHGSARCIAGGRYVGRYGSTVKGRPVTGSSRASVVEGPSRKSAPQPLPADGRDGAKPSWAQSGALAGLYVSKQDPARSC